MTQTTVAEPFTEWQARNPLRVYRKESGMTMSDIAARIGVSITALQKWESGTSEPNYANMHRIEAMTGRAIDATAWKDWLDSAPDL